MPPPAAVPSSRPLWPSLWLAVQTPPPADSAELTQSDRACSLVRVLGVRALVSCCERVNVRLSQGDESSSLCLLYAANLH